MEDPPNLLCAVLMAAPPTVCKLFLEVASDIPPLVKFSNNVVLVIAVKGAVGGVNEDV
jgi:hypothetical protein